MSDETKELRHPVSKTTIDRLKAIYAEKQTAAGRVALADALFAERTAAILDEAGIRSEKVTGFDDTNDVYALLYIPAQPLPLPPK